MEEKSGAYRLDCGECSGVYRGESDRQLRTKVEEYTKAWRPSSASDSIFVDDLITSGHHNFVEGAEILLHQENIYRKRLACEDIEIIRHLRKSILAEVEYNNQS